MFIIYVFQTIALLRTALSLIAISFTSSFTASLFFMATALSCISFHKAGIVLNSQDIAPKFVESELVSDHRVESND